MSGYSFDIKTSKEFFNKLIEDYKEYCSDKTSSKAALNCAMSATHLSEWIYNEFNQQLLPQFKKFKLYRSDLEKQCPSLQIMRDIANGTKHYEITLYTPIIKDTSIHEGAFDQGFSRAFDITTLDIELKNGATVSFEDEIDKAINFWKAHLKTFNIDV